MCYGDNITVQDIENTQKNLRPHQFSFLVKKSGDRTHTNEGLHATTSNTVQLTPSRTSTYSKQANNYTDKMQIVWKIN